MCAILTRWRESEPDEFETTTLNEVEVVLIRLANDTSTSSDTEHMTQCPHQTDTIT